MVKRLSIAFVTSLVLLSLSIPIASAVKALATSGLFAGVPNGYAYAVYILSPTGSGSANYGPSVPVALSCTTPPGTNTLTNSGPALRASPLVGSGSATSTITIDRTQASDTVQTSEDIHNLSIFAGAITANEIDVVVTSTTSSAGASSSNSTTFHGLVVDGLPVSSNPPSNTSLPLPGLGSVTLNEQSGPFDGSDTTSIGVIAMDVHITHSNSLGLASDSEIVLALAQSGINPSAVSDTAYGLYGLGPGGSTPNVGPGAVAGISCSGGSSTISSNGVTDSAIGSAGTESSSASGQTSSSDANATGQNSISNADLLTGLVSADKVTTVANVAWNSSGSSSRSGSTTLQNASIAGTPLPTNPAPNTREDLPSIGYALVNEQFGSNDASGAEENVIGIDIYVTVANNSLGLPVGTRIIVSLVSVGATSY